MKTSTGYQILYDACWEQLSAPTPIETGRPQFTDSNILITYRRLWSVRQVHKPLRLGGTIQTIDSITYHVYLMVTGTELRCTEEFAAELQTLISERIAKDLPPEDVRPTHGCKNCTYIIDPGQPPRTTEHRGVR